MSKISFSDFPQMEKSVERRVPKGISGEGAGFSSEIFLRKRISAKQILLQMFFVFFCSIFVGGDPSRNLQFYCYKNAKQSVKI